jgi:hypothetical protein
MTHTRHGDISIDWTPFGVVVSAMVMDTRGETRLPWLESLQIINLEECDSEWHSDYCECPSDQQHLDAYRDHLTRNGYTLQYEEED